MDTKNHPIKNLDIPYIPEEERTPAVNKLLEICFAQREIIASLQEQMQLLKEELQALRDEIARLKGLKPKPAISPSKMDEDTDINGKKKDKRRKGRCGKKRHKTKALEIHQSIVIPPPQVPEGSRFKGYDDFTVQDIVIRTNNIRYRLERWLTPSGEYVVGKLPPELRGGHFGPTLIIFILYQYYHAHVTEPLLLEELWEFGIDISSGQLNRIIIEGKERFHEEKADILRVGLDVSNYIHVDDTGARHKGKNGYCTHIGNEYFAWFASTESKSRLNFLRLLRAGYDDYMLNDEAFEYMRGQSLSKSVLGKLEDHEQTLLDEDSFQAMLKSMDITDERHVRIVTEGALLGSVVEHGVDPGLVIMSDDAGQFNLFRHALCWIHAERTIKKLIGFTDEQRAALDDIRSQIWDFYADLKAYKTAPDEDKKVVLSERFDKLFTTKTCFASLNLALERLYKNKSELLLVLDHPELPLQNNLSENDIREYVKTRKVSGSTRSDEGRRCRDTFTSLKKTCRKLGISFWAYLRDRVFGMDEIAPMSEVIESHARAAPA